MAGCPCGSCAAPTWTPEEATDAARHLNNREAVDLALGRARVLSFTDCPDCGAWKATVVPVEPTGDGVVIAMPVIST